MPIVTEPALIAVIGVGGVLVGALASGSVQATLARAERRRYGRNAARVLYMQLHDAEKAVNDLRELRDWAQMITDWDAYSETWAQYRDPLASVLNTRDFAKVAAAFGCLASLSRSHKRDARQLGGTPGFDPTDEYLALCLKTVQDAKRIALGASFRWWETKERNKALAERGPPSAPASD
jgi:hypothetical protein